MKNQKKPVLGKERQRAAAKPGDQKKILRAERRNTGVGRESIEFLAPAFSFRPTP